MYEGSSNTKVTMLYVAPGVQALFIIFEHSTGLAPGQGLAISSRLEMLNGVELAQIGTDTMLVQLRGNAAERNEAYVATFELLQSIGLILGANSYQLVDA